MKVGDIVRVKGKWHFVDTYGYDNVYATILKTTFAIGRVVEILNSGVMLSFGDGKHYGPYKPDDYTVIESAKLSNQLVLGNKRFNIGTKVKFVDTNIEAIYSIDVAKYISRHMHDVFTIESMLLLSEGWVYVLKEAKEDIKFVYPINLKRA